LCLKMVLNITLKINILQYLCLLHPPPPPAAVLAYLH
jgi:hypothetical protein